MDGREAELSLVLRVGYFQPSDGFVAPKLAFSLVVFGAHLSLATTTQHNLEI